MDINLQGFKAFILLSVRAQNITAIEKSALHRISEQISCETIWPTIDIL